MGVQTGGSSSITAPEEDEFTTSNEKVGELLKHLPESKYLYSYGYYDEQSVARLELHLHTYVAALE
uniref:Uncharacterized protein n=1 Tax=Rhizophagus irregularis (strain DAOM 181602 / DAOM 197198 / MUCL 43194) TaxID=747089 RepID=U9UE54_RHIID